MAKNIKITDFDIKEVKNCVKITLPFLKHQTNDIEDLSIIIANLTHKYYIQLLKDVHEKYAMTSITQIHTTN